MDFARRIRRRAASDAGTMTNAEGITTSSVAPEPLPTGNTLVHLRLLNSRRITFADENRLGDCRIGFNARVCIRTGGTDANT